MSLYKLSKQCSHPHSSFQSLLGKKNFWRKKNFFFFLLKVSSFGSRKPSTGDYWLFGYFCIPPQRLDSITDSLSHSLGGRHFIDGEVEAQGGRHINSVTEPGLELHSLSQGSSL